MYVTMATRCTLDSGPKAGAVLELTARRSKLVGDPIRGFNRGWPLGDRSFKLTTALVALHRLNGSLLWEADFVGTICPLRTTTGDLRAVCGR
jgi:hypothetical protein